MVRQPDTRAKLFIVISGEQNAAAAATAWIDMDV